MDLVIFHFCVDKLLWLFLRNEIKVGVFSFFISQMWMNAKPSLGSVKGEIALILLDLLSANAQLDTSLMK